MTAPSLEKTLMIVKPDGVGKRVAGKIIDRLESEGFQLLAVKMIRPTAELMEGFYAEHRGKPFFEGLVKFMTSGPAVVVVWLGPDAVARLRQLIGATDPSKAAPGTLRAQWGTDNRRNLVHASDSPASARGEIAYFFKEEEVAYYDPDRWFRSEYAPPRPTPA